MAVNEKKRCKVRFQKLVISMKTKLRSAIRFLYISLLNLLHPLTTTFFNYCISTDIPINRLNKDGVCSPSCVDKDKTVLNLSSDKLSDIEIMLLSSGLQFNIPPHNLDPTDIMTSFESLFK